MRILIDKALMHFYMLKESLILCEHMPCITPSEGTCLQVYYLEIQLHQSKNTHIS